MANTFSAFFPDGKAKWNSSKTSLKGWRSNQEFSVWGRPLGHAVQETLVFLLRLNPIAKILAYPSNGDDTVLRFPTATFTVRLITTVRKHAQVCEKGGARWWPLNRKANLTIGLRLARIAPVQAEEVHHGYQRHRRLGRTF